MEANMVAVQALKEAITTLLTEAYEGPPDPTSTWFVDNEPDAGIFGLLKDVSAEEASVSADRSGNPGTSIAANVEHLRWSLALSNAMMRGEDHPGKWAESWLVSTVDEGAWDRLRGELRAEFEALRDGIRRQTQLPGEYLPGVLALLPHAAFHLGMMRQMIERVRGV